MLRTNTTPDVLGFAINQGFKLQVLIKRAEVRAWIALALETNVLWIASRMIALCRF